MNNFLLLLVTIIWGSTFFIIKDAVVSVNEYVIVFGRLFLASIPMFFLILFKNKKNFLNKQALFNGSILGCLLAITYLSQTIGLKYTSSGHSAFITGIAIVLVPAIMFFVFKNKIFRSDLLSIIIVTTGLFLLTYDFNTDFNKGDIITLITAVSAAFHITLSGRFVKKTEPLTMIFYQFLSGSIVSSLGFLVVDFEVNSILLNALPVIIYLGFIGTLFCYFVTVWVQKFVSSVRVALFFSLEPVFAVFFGYLALHETLSIKEIIGMLLILSGVLIYQILRNFYSKKMILAVK